jgi:hypothetical protein
MEGAHTVEKDIQSKASAAKGPKGNEALSSSVDLSALAKIPRHKASFTNGR